MVGLTRPAWSTRSLCITNMASRSDAIVYGPFNAEYHRVIVNDTFKRALREFLASKLLPQLDHAFTDAIGTLTACFNEDRFCGPNSLARDCFCLEFAFRGTEGESRMKTERRPQFRWSVRHTARSSPVPLDPFATAQTPIGTGSDSKKGAGHSRPWKRSPILSALLGTECH